MTRSSLAVFLLVVFAASAFGQAKWGGLARQIAMGGSSAGQGVVLNPFIWEDPTLLLVNPAYQTKYKDYFWTNIGGGTLAGLSTADNGYGLQNAGINFALNREWAIGAILSYDPSFINTARTLVQGTGALGIGGVPSVSIAQRSPQAIPPVANVWEAVVSYDGAGIDLGFGFMYGSSDRDSSASAGTTSSRVEASARVFGVRAGGIIDLGSGNAVDFGVAYRIDKATDKISQTPVPTSPTDGEYSVSGNEFQVQARGRFKLSNRVSVVPYAAFATLSGEPKEDSKPTTATTATTRAIKVSLSSVAFGIGTEYKTPDIFLATGISFFTASGKIEYNQAASGTLAALTATGTVSNTAIPVFNIGGEWWFLDWLAGRAGYYRALGNYKLKVESAIGGVATTFEAKLSTPSSFLLFGNVSSDQLVTLGLGLRFGNFSLDATVSEEALRRGFGIIGAQDNINSFGFMTASYSFE